MNTQNNSHDDWGFYVDIETDISPDLTVTDEIHHRRNEKCYYFTNTYYDSNDMCGNNSTSNRLSDFIVLSSLTIINTAYHVLSFLNIID